ncbi:cellulase [Actinoplanes sp. N902-109]|nr:cellulase [Actinoplanes sp. N902-109]
MASPSASSSPTPSKTKAAKPPAPVRTSASPTPPAPAAAFTARYRTTASWDTGFIGYVQVTNAGDAPGAWSVTVTYPSSAGVTIIGTWNAQRSGTTFTGDTLAPGASASFGFSANKQVRGKVKPSGCTVAGASCRIG